MDTDCDLQRIIGNDGYSGMKDWRYWDGKSIYYNYERDMQTRIVLPDKCVPEGGKSDK